MRRFDPSLDAKACLEVLSTRPVQMASLTAEGAPLAWFGPADVEDGWLCLPGVSRDLAGRAAAIIAEESIAPVPPGFPLGAPWLCRRVALRGVLVRRGPPEQLGLPLTGLQGTAWLGQELEAAERARLVQALWARGGATDALAIDRILAASPDTPRPRFLDAPEGAALRCALGREELAQAAGLLAAAYWNQGTPPERVQGAMLGAQAWVGACDGSGKLIAHARAISDGAKYAWIYDVMVEPRWRGRGLGQAVFRLALDHPAVRGAHAVLLGTRDAQAFYARFGFVDRQQDPGRRPYPTTEMVLRR